MIDKTVGASWLTGVPVNGTQPETSRYGDLLVPNYAID